MVDGGLLGRLGRGSDLSPLQQCGGPPHGVNGSRQGDAEDISRIERLYYPARLVAEQVDALKAQVAAAVSAPAGRFRWRYKHTPRELSRLWLTGQANEITRGAVMTFQHRHGLVVDGIAGPLFWQALIADAIAGKRRTVGYSYVFVHRALPQSLNLWHNGHVILKSPGNTGVPAAPTALGTFPVFEHVTSSRMQGTNPDGSTYDDPAVPWASYFNGGDALHGFVRASYGTPQSNGCVEMPIATAAQVWPLTPIGTPVTVIGPSS